MKPFALRSRTSAFSDLMSQVTVLTKQCLRCGKRFPSRNKLMQHLFPSSSDPFPCGQRSGAPDSRSDRQVQQQGSDLSSFEPRQADLSSFEPRQADLSTPVPSQASLSSFQPSAVTSLPRSQPSLSESQSSPSRSQSLHPLHPLSPSPASTVGTQLNASVGGADRGSASGTGMLPWMEVMIAVLKGLNSAMEEVRLEHQTCVQETSTKETSTKEALPKDVLTEETLTEEKSTATTLPTGSTRPTPIQSVSSVALLRPPSPSSDTGTDERYPHQPTSSVGRTAGHVDDYTDDSSDDSDGHLDCRDRSACETSRGQGRHHCGSGTYDGGYGSVRNNDGDTEELCHGSMPRAQGSGSSYEIEDSGDDCSDDPDDSTNNVQDDHHTGCVESYNNEGQGGCSDGYDHGYDDCYDDDYDDYDDDYYD